MKKQPGLGDLLKKYIEDEYRDLEVDTYTEETCSPERVYINLIHPLTALVVIYPTSNDVYYVTVRNTSNEPWAYVNLNPADPEYIPLLKKTIATARANRMKWSDITASAKWKPLK